MRMPTREKDFDEPEAVEEESESRGRGDAGMSGADLFLLTNLLFKDFAADFFVNLFFTDFASSGLV
jgi:hypothetical protein